MGISQPNKQIENEAVFREENERIEKRRIELNSMAEQDKQPELSNDSDAELMYLCECSDEDCRQRIQLLMSVYKDIHTHRNNFIVIPGHGVPEIEEIIEINNNYSIVCKFTMPSEINQTLQKTDIDNSLATS